MSRGYITIAQNSEDNDYLEMSYALALSQIGRASCRERV